jgi:RimJ/RimL family protein N-acetyltransferase
MDLTIIYIAETSLRGKGYGIEGIRAVLEYAFSVMNLHRLSINHFLDDVVSERLYDKIGFRKEGIMKSAGKQGNEFNDLQLRAMLKEEWEEQKEILAATEPEKVPKVVKGY